MAQKRTDVWSGKTISVRNIISVTKYHNDIYLLSVNTNNAYLLSKYDIESDTICESIPFETTQTDELVDCLMQCLAIIDGTIYFILPYGGVVTFRISTNQWADYVVDDDNNDYDAFESIGGSAVTVNDSIHMMTAHGMHIIWKAGHYEVIESFQQFKEHEESARVHARMVYIKHQNKLLLVGGDDDQFNMDTDDILLFDLETREWIKTHQKLPYWKMYGFGCILTYDERYVILFGGNIDQNWHYDGKTSIDDVYIIDTETLSITKSMIKCPMKSGYYAVSSNNSENNKFMVIGYIRNCWKLQIFETMRRPCDDIIRLIQAFSLEETVHLFTSQESYQHKYYHWKINLDQILRKPLKKQ